MGYVMIVKRFDLVDKVLKLPHNLISKKEAYKLIAKIFEFKQGASISKWFNWLVDNGVLILLTDPCVMGKHIYKVNRMADRIKLSGVDSPHEFGRTAKGRWFKI